MFDYKVKIGLVPMRRDTNNRPKGTFLTWYSAEERGERFVRYIDLIHDAKSAAAMVERMKREGVDAVFIINCNFGNEEAAADIAKAMGKPVLLWAPLDDEYYVDGMRPTDSQCGLFGVSRQMQRFHIPFSHLPCCRVESDEFKDGFLSFVRVACMVKNFTGLRIGQIGLRPAPFYSVIWNEGELMEKFGLKIIPINFALIEQRMKATLDERPAEMKEIADGIRKNYRMDDLTPKYVDTMAAYAVTLKRLYTEFDLDAISAECWTATPVMFDGFAPCTVYSILNDMGYLVSCESDMHCLLTMILLKSATLGEGKPLFGEFTVRHPEDRNAELLWHCGPFPLSQKAESGVGSTARLVNQRSWFRAKDGVYTVARLDQESGRYVILPLVGKTTEGPATHGTYLWVKFDDLQKIEDRIIDGPYIHHFTEIAGDYTREIREFCKYFPNLETDRI